MTLLATMTCLLTGAVSGPAGASVRIENHNLPAGDPTVFQYHLERPAPLPPIDFPLRDGEWTGFGPFEGITSAQVVPQPGWQLADIQCVGPPTETFSIDLAAGRVTTFHGLDDETICSFTNRRISASDPAAAPAPGSGLAPAPPASRASQLALPNRAVVLRVKGARGFAGATLRLPRSATIKMQLLSRRTRVVGSAVAVRKPGIYDLSVSLEPRFRRQARRQGRKRVNLTLRVVVRERSGSTRVFRYGVLVGV